MTENEKVTAFEKKLLQLKEEERLILKILKDVQKQLKKYEVEELQTSSECILDRADEEESDSDESVECNRELLLKVLDCADLVNDSTLNLGLKKIFEESESEKSEESD